MKHAIVPFPYGAREGDLVIRITDVAGDSPVDIAGELQTFYRLQPFREVWVDLADVAGAGQANKLGLQLRKLGYEVLVVGPVEATSWPFFPARLIVDVTGFLSADAPDLTLWADVASKKLGANPPATEIFAVAPAPTMLVADTLGVLDTFADAPDGCTLYVAPDEIDRAVAASIRCPRPWIIRRLGALPPRPRAAGPAAAPSA